MNTLLGCCRERQSLSVGSACLKDVINTIEIIATEATATLRYVLPASLKWLWRKYITNSIKTVRIQVTQEKTSKIAYLNIHGNCPINKDKECTPILLNHGDYGHPYTMLHLADIAEKKGLPAFSLYIPQVKNNKQFDIHSDLLQQAANKIESIVKNKHGNFAGILGVGHSKGGILLAERQFVALDSRIKAICCIASRLNVPDEKACRDPILKNTLKTIYKGILKNSERPLMQIIPKNDWNASYRSMAARPHKYCYTVPGKHLSGLYSYETRGYIKGFINEFRYNKSLKL